MPGNQVAVPRLRHHIHGRSLCQMTHGRESHKSTLQNDQADAPGPIKPWPVMEDGRNVNERKHPPGPSKGGVVQPGHPDRRVQAESV